MMVEKTLSMKTMHAVSIYSYGGPEVLFYREVPCPHPADGEVLVRVHAAGINPVDWKIREGHLKGMLPHTFPLILGWDVSGVVSSVGRSGVSRLKVGDEVFSRPDIVRDGAYAEYIVIKESEVALKPNRIEHIHAAAIPLAGLAAWDRWPCNWRSRPVPTLSAPRREKITTSLISLEPTKSSTTRRNGLKTSSKRWTWFSTRWAAKRRSVHGRC